MTNGPLGPIQYYQSHYFTQDQDMTSVWCCLLKTGVVGKVDHGTVWEHLKVVCCLYAGYSQRSVRNNNYADDSKWNPQFWPCIVHYKIYHTIVAYNSIACPMFYCRSFENNLRTYKLLAHRKPESELPVVSHLTTSWHSLWDFWQWQCRQLYCSLLT